MEAHGHGMPTNHQGPSSRLIEKNIRVLVVEDEQEIRDLICLHLLRQGFKVTEAGTAEEALDCLRAADFDLLVLDWMLPGQSGLELLKGFRSASKRLPVLMITARVEPKDIVEGLEAGADDYLSKPFEPAVMIARVRALLRRADPAPIDEENSQQVVLGNLTVDFQSYSALCQNAKLSLTPSEFKLLSTMVQNIGKVLTRDQLIQEVQGEGVSVVGRTVDTHIFGLRKKLGTCCDFIETIRGVGYRIKPVD